MKALVVDDSRAMRMILKRALTQEGFECVEAGNGQEALEVLESNPVVELALVDWNMPVMTGYEFLCEIRGKTCYDSVAVMMVTTETEISQVEKALDAGANEYVMKPFTPEVLREKLILLGVLAA